MSSSVITKVSPIATKAGKNAEITVTGLHFTDGGNPRAYIGSTPISIKSFTDTEVVIVLPYTLDVGNYHLTILNGSEIDVFE